MSPTERYQLNMREATPLEKELAFLLQEISFKNTRLIPEDPERVAPLYIEQARVLSHNHNLRSRVSLILSRNAFAQDELVQ